jgi:hypothetical protein
MMAIKKKLCTPHQKYLTRLTEMFERLLIDKQLLREELEVQAKVLTAKAEHKNGKRIVL